MTPPQLSATDSSNPVILEMRKGIFLDVDNALNQFHKLNKDIRLFCQQCSDHIARLEPIPWPTVHSSFSPESSPVGKPAHDFLSLEDYLYFVLLSIVNRRLCESIFRPFHPAAPVQESDSYKREYSRRTGMWHVSIFSGALDFKSLALQAQSAEWRSEVFSSIDNRVTADIFANLIPKFAETIIHELKKALEQLPDQLSFPDSFLPGLDSILKDAYNWNRTVKKDILKYDFEPYVINPLSTWDPAQMESFERVRIPIQPQSKVISPVSLGLVGIVRLGNARVPRVHRKARVLLEGWFASGSGGRTMNTSPGSRSAMPVSPIPFDQPSCYRTTPPHPADDHNSPTRYDTTNPSGWIRKGFRTFQCDACSARPTPHLSSCYNTASFHSANDHSFPARYAAAGPSGWTKERRGACSASTLRHRPSCDKTTSSHPAHDHNSPARYTTADPSGWAKEWFTPRAFQRTACFTGTPRLASHRPPCYRTTSSHPADDHNSPTR